MTEITARDMLKFDAEDDLLDAAGLKAIEELLLDDEDAGMVLEGDDEADASDWPAWTDDFFAMA